MNSQPVGHLGIDERKKEKSGDDNEDLRRVETERTLGMCRRSLRTDLRTGTDLHRNGKSLRLHSLPSVRQVSVSEEFW